MRELLAGKYGKLRETLVGVEENVTGRVQRAADRARGAKDHGKEQVRELADDVDRRVHDDPWAAVGWAAAGALLIGFVLGRKH